jgi:ankyrin repeat protein
MPAKTKFKRARGKKGSSILAKARRDPRFRLARERDALIEAIRCNQPELASSLLAQGVDPNSTDAKGRSALWHAAHWGRSDLIRDLVQRGARLPDDVLMGPVHDGDAEMVRLLIRHGANVNCVAVFTRYSWKFPQKEILLSEAIRHAVMARSVEDAIARHRKSSRPLKRADYEAVPIMLIKAGARVNGLAFKYAIYQGFVRTILGMAAMHGFTRTVKAMLAAGADVNQRDTWGGTPLFDAAHEGQREVVRILLRAGAKTNLKRRDGATPASIARQRGFPEIAELIEKHS